MKEDIEKIIEWTKLKIKLFIRSHKEIYFYEREIWWVSLGKNIGFEENGKNDNFERPVLVLKKFNKQIFWGLPITTKNKKSKYYCSINYNDKEYSVILSQIRLISSKRLLRKIRKLSPDEFTKVKNRFKMLI